MGCCAAQQSTDVVTTIVEQETANDDADKQIAMSIADSPKDNWT